MHKTTQMLQALRLVGLAAFVGGFPNASPGATVSASSAPIRVDARDLTHRRMVTPEALAYSPYWQNAADGANRAVRIEVVTDPDTANAATATLFTADTGVESTYAWTPSAAAQPFCRLLHWTLDGGTPTGAPLACDAAIGACSTVAAALWADTRTNSLQEVADANGTADLTYSPRWGSGTSAKVERVLRRTEAAPETTNDLFQSAAGVESAFPLSIGSLPSGHYLLRHIALDASAQPVGDALTAEFDIRRPPGLLLRVF